MRVLVTGAAGGVGSEVIARLVDTHSVVGVDQIRGGSERVDWRVGSVTDMEFLAEAMKGVDVVVHLAAVPIYDPTLNNEIAELNIVGTQRVFEAAVRTGVRRVVQASSICATGLINRSTREVPPGFPLDEGYSSLPDDLYGLSKLVSEQLAAAYRARYGVEHTELRMATVWRPDHAPTDELLGELLSPEHDDDLAYRDLRWQYVDVRDAADAFVLAVEAERGVGVVNIGAADTPGGDWRLWVGHAYPERADTELAPEQPLWDITRARAELGFAPRHSWRDYPVYVDAFTQQYDRLRALAGTMGSERSR
ncbi:MAG TPA: NAD(P)-dependent oxidoreductase [Protaetiibacter sp.]|nr:NAD(P)-dependent oxidoreductase [Protaetiibacter sp.]